VLADHGSRRGRPGIVGYWVLEKPGVINPSQTLTEFHADGTYVIRDTANGQSGTYEAINGNWSLTSNTSESPRRDSVPTWITADGQVSHEADDNGYIAQYNKDMEAARRSLAALIARNSRATGLYALYGCAQGDDACVTERQESEAFSETMCMLVAPYQDASSPPCVVDRYRGN
jgi:hypothetical protein